MLSQLRGADLERLMDSIGAPTFIVGTAGEDHFVVIYANKALQSATGLPAESVRGQLPEEMIRPEQAKIFKHHYRLCSQTGEPVIFEVLLTLPVGERWLRITLNPVRDQGGSGAVVRMLGTMVDVTEERRVHETLRYQNLLLQAQQDLSPDGIMIADVHGTLLNWNARLSELWGVTEEIVRQGREALLPRILAQLVDPGTFLTMIEEAYRNLHENIVGYEVELKNGKIYQIFSRGLIDECNLGRGRIWFLRDITESRIYQRRLSEALALQRAILDSARQIILSVDRNLVFRSFNAAAERLLGYKAEEVIGKKTALILHDPAEIEERRAVMSQELGRDVSVYEMFQGQVLKGMPLVQEWSYICKDGSRLPVELSLTRLDDEQGSLLGFLAIVTDITERKETERQLFELATTDALTKLWNRRHFAEQAERSLIRARRYDEHICIALIDIDHFKRINDTYGHAAGDAVLYHLARALDRMLRGSDFMCRWGGEEFAVLLLNTDPSEALQIAERMRRTVMRLEVNYEDARVPVTASIGLSDCLSCDQSLDVILSRADEALYAAKAAGRNCVRAVWSHEAAGREPASSL